jgi:hypothetical protein
MRQTEKTYHDNGQLKEEIETVNNKREGVYKLFHKNGQLRVETNYKNGKQLDQVINSFDENGNLIRTVELKKELLTGPFVEYFSTGEIKHEGVYKKNKIHKGSQKVYLKNGDIVINKVNTFEEFKNLYNYYISNFLFDDFDTRNIIIGIPKFSIYTEIQIDGTFKNYKFKGVLHEICKWIDYDFFYKSHNDFYNDLLKISNKKLDFNFLDDLANIGKFEYGAPGEGLEIIKVIFEDGTPITIKNEFESILDEKDIEDFSTTGLNYGDTIYSEIAYFKMELINSQYDYNFEIIWENVDEINKKIKEIPKSKKISTNKIKLEKTVLEKTGSNKVVNSKNVILGQSYYLDPTLEVYGKVISIEHDSIYFELQSEDDGSYVTESDNTIGFQVCDNIDFIEKNK